MKITLAVLAVLMLAPAGAQAQRVNIDHLDRLKDRAEEVVEVDIDERLLKLFASFIPGNDSEQKAAREFIVGLRGIWVRNFEFSRSQSYAPDDVTSIRRQLTGSKWVKMVTVDKPRDGETVDVHFWMDDDKIGGLAVVVAEATKLIVVNIVGPIDIAKLTALAGKNGIPEIPKVSGPEK